MLEHSIDHSSSNLAKIKLFRSLFVGREDVFARRYENEKKGTSGYTPCCRNQWGAGCVLKQHKKCSECTVRQYVPVSDEVIRWHLRGKDADMKTFVMGIYPMEADETVRVAVIDFDESSWRRDAILTVRKARELGLTVALEKSRSGKGAHLWFFLQTSVAAKAIREVLTYVMTLVIEEHPEVGLDSYDRIIPNQDTLPKGGFGNPEFSKKQRMKYSVYGESRIISRALNGDEFLQVPRGCLESALQILKGERLNPVVDDKRYAGVPIDVTFKGALPIANSLW